MPVGSGFGVLGWGPGPVSPTSRGVFAPNPEPSTQNYEGFFRSLLNLPWDMRHSGEAFEIPPSMFGPGKSKQRASPSVIPYVDSQSHLMLSCLSHASSHLGNGRAGLPSYVQPLSGTSWLPL